MLLSCTECPSVTAGDYELDLRLSLRWWGPLAFENHAWDTCLMVQNQPYRPRLRLGLLQGYRHWLQMQAQVAKVRGGYADSIPEVCHYRMPWRMLNAQQKRRSYYKAFIETHIPLWNATLAIGTSGYVSWDVHSFSGPVNLWVRENYPDPAAPHWPISCRSEFV